ncbi:MAG: hypothetical protein J7M05_03005 [Anaerolineae bacterium]|nr:hypothetical protein [Anaerolineae bacterium]
MSEILLTCPYCGGSVPQGTTICPDCHENLAALIHLKYKHAIYYNEALALAREGNLEGAQERLLVALSLKDDFLPGHILLAKVYAHQGRWDKAQATALRAAELAPKGSQEQKLAREIAKTAQKEEALRRAQEEAAARARRAQAERYLASHQKEVASAFGIGMGLAAFLSWLISRFRRD